MSANFVPQHTEGIPFNGLTAQQFLVLAVETAMRLGLQLVFISDEGLVARTNNSNIHEWNGEIRIGIYPEQATAFITSLSLANDIIDMGRNQHNVQLFLSFFNDLRSVLTTDELAAKYVQIQPFLSPANVTAQPQQHAAPPPEKSGGIRGMFIPSEGYFFTPILIYLNVLLFIIMIASGVDIMEPDGASLLKWGANFKPLTLSGEWWRLITCCFLHIGVVHLLMNMYALLFVGTLLEPYLGKMRFFAAYLLTGITASVVSLWWHDQSLSAGASGAIFGMYGVFLAMLTTNLIEKSARKPLLFSIGAFVVYNLVYSMGTNNDNAAHIGGLLSGMFIGYSFTPGLKRPEKKNAWLTTLLLSVLILGGSFLVYKNLPNDYARYDQKMSVYARNEQSANISAGPETKGNKDSILQVISNGIHKWEENVAVTREIAAMKLPDYMLQRNQLLISYSSLRVRDLELTYKAVNETTDAYDSLLSTNRQQLSEAMQQLMSFDKRLRK